jgi:hypothetical protein
VYGASISDGPLNPTLAFELWIWDLGAYNDKVGNLGSIFNLGHLGRYIWIYMGSSCIGGCIAGMFYRTWVKQLIESLGEEDQEEIQEYQNSSFLEEMEKNNVEKPRYPSVKAVDVHH